MPTRGKRTLPFPPADLSCLTGDAPINRRALVDGHGISIYCDRQRPLHWAEQEHPVAKVLIALGSARCCVTWWDSAGDAISRTIGDGDMVILAPGVRHSKQWLNDAGIIILYLSKSWLRQFGRPRIEGVLIESIRDWSLRDPLIGGLTQEIRQTCIPHRDRNRGQLLALGTCLAARLMRRFTLHESVTTPVVRRLNRDTMRRVDALITAQLSEKLSVAAVAREARLSTSHFGLLFKATTGMTCRQYIRHFRLARAKGLLSSGAYTVGQVAHMTGFADHSHLTFVFSKHFGAPPRAFLPRERIV